MSGKKLTGAGLRGQSAGETKLCTVGKSGSGLTYCGYDVADLTENATFEEVAYLLFNGELPTVDQLAAYKADPLYQTSIKAVRPLRDMRIAADF